MGAKSEYPPPNYGSYVADMHVIVSIKLGCSPKIKRKQFDYNNAINNQANFCFSVDTAKWKNGFIALYLLL